MMMETPKPEPSSSPDAEDVKHARLRRRHGWNFVRRRGKFVAGLCIISLFYFAVLFADFLAPYDYRAQSRREPLAPPTPIRFRDTSGNLHARPFIYERHVVNALERHYVESTERVYPIILFARGYSYKLFGLLETDVHLFGVGGAERANVPRVHLLGTDAAGRDRLSRLLVATRFSLIVGPAGTLLASALGIFLGCIAGYAGPRTDALLMRAADTMMALPTLVLILAARAAFPLELPPARAVVLLVTIFTVVGWAEMARLARGQVLALRRREFVLAAVGLGLSPARILFRHILPNAARPLIVQASLMLPTFLLAETALSFLGVGLQEPEASWGNMLAAAGDINLLRESGLVLLTPAFALLLFVLGARLLSDNPD
ncbi:MAG: ABC transporter permease [Acidobacteriota bacterium]|nr:ABC transporter permease [Acidobacteriota bacterium]